MICEVNKILIILAQNSQPDLSKWWSGLKPELNLKIKFRLSLIFPLRDRELRIRVEYFNP